MPKLDRNPESLAYLEPDRRADGGTRRVRLSPRGIGIERAFHGVKMRLAVPIEAYRGVALSRQDRLQRGFYVVRLDHPDEDLTVTLYRTSDIAAVLDLWSNWARFFSKPALLDENISFGTDGFRKTMRRRFRPRAHRSPRALLRRRAIRLAEAPIIHEGGEFSAPE